MKVSDSTRKPAKSSRCTFSVLGLMAGLLSACDAQGPKPAFDLGTFAPASLEEIIAHSHGLKAPGIEIEFISRQFLGVPYGESRLIGDADTPETLTVNLAALDCYTYIDYVEALRRSSGYPDFRGQVAAVRYARGQVAWRTRHHFFSDWVGSGGPIQDVTAEVGGDAVVATVKHLNLDAAGAPVLKGVATRVRRIVHIPSERLDQAVVGRLRTGDYVGVFAEAPWLDVTHTGIVVKRPAGAGFRHASAARGKRGVVEEDLAAYIRGKPGIVVYRAAP